MKNTHSFLIAAAALTFLTSTGQAKAGNGACCDDGIAASPKVRAMLDERCKSRCVAPSQITATTMRHTDIAASPKVQQMRNDLRAVPAVLVATETVGYRPTGADGITASPKVRAMLDERKQTVEIAPLK